MNWRSGELKPIRKGDGPSFLISALPTAQRVVGRAEKNLLSALLFQNALLRTGRFKGQGEIRPPGTDR